MTKYRSYSEYYKAYWKAIQRGHLKLANRMHTLAHAVARLKPYQDVYDGIIDAYLK